MESIVRLYDIGRQRAEEDHDEEEEDRNEDDDDDDDDSDNSDADDWGYPIPMLSDASGSDNESMDSLLGGDSDDSGADDYFSLNTDRLNVDGDSNTNDTNDSWGD